MKKTKPAGKRLTSGGGSALGRLQKAARQKARQGKKKK